jgi:tRNA pseudouridine38-40 synthase
MLGSRRSIVSVERTIALWVAYDGTEFHGWQNQPDLRTVQSVLEQALRRVVRHQVNLMGSGRTDAGVHAAGHVSSLVTTCELEPERLRHSIGSRLPKDVSLIALRDVDPHFHATRSAVSKLYRYRIHNAPGRPVEHHTQRYTYHFWEPLDLERMRAGARHFLGEKDFAAMAAKGGKRETTVRKVLRCDIERYLDEIRIDVEGTGFLYKQVRTMVGTLLNVGRGHWAPDRIAETLESGDRANAGPTVPARGLCLQWVRYPPELLSPVVCHGTTVGEMSNGGCRVSGGEC